MAWIGVYGPVVREAWFSSYYEWKHVINMRLLEFENI